MNEQLETQLVEILQSVSTSVGDAKEFIIAELPDVVQQVLSWYTVLSVVENIIGIILFVLMVYIIRNMVVKPKSMSTANIVQRLSFMKENYNENGIDYSPGVLLWASTVLIMFAAAMSTLNIVFLKILIAPKLWLIEYAASLGKAIS